MKEVIYLLLLTTMIGCVSKSDYDRLKTEKKQLKDSLTQLQRKYDSVVKKQKVVSRRQAIAKENVGKHYSEDEALSTVKDYFSFYERDTQYKNIEIRRVDDYSFQVALETCTYKDLCDNNSAWNSVVYVLVIYNDGTYKFVKRF